MTSFSKTLAAGVALVCVGEGVVRAELIYAATQVDNNLISFDSTSPGLILNARAISGMQGGESVRALEYANGQLYALGSFSRLYTLNPATGAATGVGGVFSTLLNGNTFGMAYDLGASQFRVVSDLDQQLLVTSAGVASVSASVQYAAGDINAAANPVLNALAFSGGSLYGMDSTLNILTSLNLANGNLTSIGPLGVDVSRYNGLAVGPSGTMYLGSPASSGGLAADLYTVNRTTGAATLIGHVGDPGSSYLLNGIAVVPEPSSMALMGLGGLAMLGYMWRRRS